jgi:hypothetical protein
VNRPLGKRQQALLEALQRHGSWSENCGWHWDGPGLTTTILDGLVRRGLVERQERPHGPRYTLTPAARMVVGPL